MYYRVWESRWWWGGEGVRSSIPRFIERNIEGREAIPHLIPGVATKPD